MNSPSSKLRVAVLYGGRSGEHEISLLSAASVIRHLDPSKYEIVPIGIDREGRWLLNDIELIESNREEALPALQKSLPEVILPPRAGATHRSLISLENSNSKGWAQEIDVVFPVLHGPMCEDGTIQGFLELAEVPYVGPGVLSSALSMDKEMAKKVVQAEGIPVVPYLKLKKDRFNWDQVMSEVKKNLGYPVFVKPANMGSSVGIHKVKSEDELVAAVTDAFQYDVKVLLEKNIDAREIEFAVLESLNTSEANLVSVPGEIKPSHEFYSYDAKYLDEKGADLMIPSPLSDEQKATATKMASQIFEILECAGMARIDLFLDRKSGEFYFNEVNTIPGFTSISMYPKLMEASGVPYSELLDRLIQLALKRRQELSALRREK